MKQLITMLVCAYLISCKKDESPCRITDIYQKYGGSSFEAATSVIESSECGYLFGGITRSNDGDVAGNHGSTDAWIVKVNNHGTIQWQKTFGGTSGDQANALTSDNRGKYVMAGFSQSIDGDAAGNHGGQDAFLVGFNEQGTRTWQKMLGGSESDAAKSIITTSDEGYVIAGLSNSNNGDVSGNHGSFDAWIVKLDRWGHLVWQKSYGGSGVDIANAIINTSDGGYLVVGETASNNGDVSGNHGENDMWVLKLDKLGTIQWKKVFGGNKHEAAFAALQARDGGYIISGYTEMESSGEGFENTWIIKLSKQGSLTWQKIFNIQSAGGNAITMSDKNGYTLVAGSMIMKIDENGNEVWRKSESGTFQSIFTRKDGSYILAGGITNGVKNSDALLATVR